MNELVSQDVNQSLWVLGQSARIQAEEMVKGGHFETTPAREAAILVNQLRILSGPVTFAHDRLRGQALAKLAQGDLWSFHPDKPASLDELLTTQEVGMSKSEASDLLAMEQIVFPFFKERTGMSEWEVWQQLPKTRWRRIIRFLRPIINPDYKVTSEDVKTTLKELEGAVDGEDKQMAMAEKIVEIAAEAQSSKDLEKGLRLNPIPPATLEATRHTAHILDENGNEVETIVTYDLRGTITHDQMELLQRYNHLDIHISPGQNTYRRVDE
jgi:hypothetical protein